MTSRRRQSLIEHRGCQVLMGGSHPEGRRKSRHPKERRASLGSSLELQSATFLGTNEENGNSRRRAAAETEAGSPNKLAIELIKCLIGIFLNLKKTALKRKGSASIPKHSLPCSNSKGLVSRATFGCRTPLNHNVSQPDPYGVLHEPEFSIRDVGPYKNFIQITKSSVDLSRFSDQCLPDRLRLRALLQKLSMISTSWLNHKQKLAFWINVYNACIMHAFLQHGLPSTPERHLALINQAAINVGGITLHAFTIEHFILRHPIEAQQDLTNEKERLLISHACGLGYPEPNVIFALCRGSWSSPALKYYTPDEVMNELEKAKVEYLEASLGITSEKKILVPKLMQWHMKDFADDVESLVEWIYSQLPQTSSLKRLIKECLHGETQSPSQKPIEIQPYVSEFRYLLPL